MHEQINPNDQVQHAWSFIAGPRDKNEAHEIALSRRVKKEIGIKVEKIRYISESCYYARLTDDDVNKIVRTDGKLLDFFSPKELKKLSLTHSTEEFITRHGALI